MKIKLIKKPKKPVIIEGFPGFGLVGTIACEFLIDHLNTELIGKVLLEEEPAMVAIHKGKIIEPLSISYNKKYNLVIIHSLTVKPGLEWKISDIIIAIAKELNTKEIISLESVSSPDIMGKPKIFYYSNDEKKEKIFRSFGLNPLKEGIIMGVSSALLLKVDKIPMSCIFAETHTTLPDSKAAAEIIKILDKYLNLKVDYKPLLETAKQFEDKLKELLQQSKTSIENREKKALSYVG
ncbi:MAG: PAC2 family protein [Nanoarchaeota archaeon]|nr:PAC2 family protein [Nanoarchaeota archaeon]MBU4284029.1 PAC2 family protein [Nanoarchaeota archaeon]MBU4493331.1 PAC2 family protein [Nanoarchaeota archaeon]